MKFAPRFLALLALLPLLLAACATEDAAPTEIRPAQIQPVAFRLTVTGKTGAVLETGATGRIEVLRKGADEAIGLDFENGELAIHELAPGHYSIARIGPLICRGLSFEVDPSASARALGSLRAEIIATDYYVALLSLAPATGAEIAALAERTGAAPGAIDTRPLQVAEAAPCFISRAGPDATWRELPLGQKIMLGIVIAGFCAIAVASGGFCAY
jgi:hypothetical protein